MKLPEFLDDARPTRHPAWSTWQDIVHNIHVTWDAVDSFTDTGVALTGYDLTVPGTETFMNASGVILSNTSNIHIPVGEEARKEAALKMLPSKNLFAVNDFSSPVYSLYNEFQGGAYELTKPASKEKRPRVFATVADLRRAWTRGELGADDPVEVMEHH